MKRAMYLASLGALVTAVLLLGSAGASLAAGGGAIAPSWGQSRAVQYVPGQVIVEFKAGVTSAKVKALAAREKASARQIRKYGLGKPGLLYTFTSKRSSTAQLLKTLSASPLVQRASADAMVHADAADVVPNDPLINTLYGLAHISAEPSWNITVGSPNVVIADLDTGVDYTHEDLVDNMWQNPAEIPANGVDDDGNGYVDDVYGVDVYNHDADPLDDNGHGTHVSGTAAAVGNNGIGVCGVVWQAKIMAVKMLSASAAQGPVSNAIEGIYYIVNEKLNHGVDVVAIMAPWGDAPNDSTLKAAIQAAGNAGMIWVASAGNTVPPRDIDANPRYPASFDLPTIVSVTATDNTDKITYYANYGATSVDVAAPGVAINSSWPGNQYTVKEGTSMSVPFVGGQIAMLAVQYPGDTVAQRIDRIFQGVVLAPSLAGKCVTGGRIDLFDSLTLDPAPVTTAPVLDGAWHASPLTVDLVASDGTGLGVDYTEYNLDGAGWTHGNQVILSADGTYNLDYHSVDKAANVEDVKSGTVKVDGTKPTVTVTGTDGIWHKVPVIIELQASDVGSGVASLEYKEDGGSWTPAGSDTAYITISTDGEHTYSYRATDNVGNVSDTGSFTVGIDSSAPDVTVGGVSPDWQNGPVDVGLSASDALSGVNYLRYRVQGDSTWTMVDGFTETIHVIDDGTHIYEYQAQDNAENQTDVDTFTVKIDTVNPTIAAVGADDAWHSGPVEVTLQGDDDRSGVASVEYRPSGTSEWTTVIGATADVNVSSDGTHDFDCRSIDNAGNLSDVGHFTVKIDSACTVSESGSDADWHAGSVDVTLTGHAISGIASVQYREQPETTWTTVAADETTVNVSGDGVKTFDYRATNNAGVVSDLGSFTVKVDNTAPETTPSGLAADDHSEWRNSAETLSFSASDAGSGVDHISYTLDGGSETPYTAPFEVSGEGSHEVTYYAVDAVGNTEVTKTGYVNIDLTAPQASVTLPPPQLTGWYTETVDILLTADDIPAASVASGVASVSYAIDGGDPVTTAGTSATISVASDGTHTVEYWASDAAGNVEGRLSTQVKVDKTAPQTFNDVDPTVWYAMPKLVNLTASDATSGVLGTEYSLDGGTTWQAGTVVTLATQWKRGGGSGIHPVMVRSTDIAGNVETPATFDVMIDTTPPTCSADAPTTPQSTNTTVHFVGYDAFAPVGQFWYSVDNGLWSQGSSVTIYAPSNHANDGMHTIRYYAIDNAGNQQVGYNVCTVTIATP